MDVLKKQRGKIKQAADALKTVRSILFITGAGVSADSGLPTYRGVGGLYNTQHTDNGIPIEMALAGETLEQCPEITWKYLLQIEKNCRNARYNRAHAVIAEMEMCFERVWVLTQNIDGFHADAGSKNIIDIHGDMHHLYCPACAWKKTVENYEGLALPPKCPDCGFSIRPDVVFFGEMLPEKKIIMLRNELMRGFDLLFTIGTTSVFPYIQQPILLAKTAGKKTVEINPGITEVSDIVDIKIGLGASDALDAIWQEFRAETLS